MKKQQQHVAVQLRRWQRRLPVSGRALLLGLVIAVAGVIGLRLSLAENTTPENPQVPSSALAAEAEKKIIVRYKPNVTQAAINDKVASVEAAADVDVRVNNEIENLRMKVLEVPKEKREQVLDVLKNDPLVEFAEPAMPRYLAATEPNDPDYFAPPMEHSFVNLLWDKHKGSPDTIIAVIDTGVSSSHADLPASRFVPGYDFVNKDSDASDDHGHGTQVAGSIAATGNNSFGIAGVCWTCRVMPLKTMSNTGVGYTAEIIDAIRFAADNGADIIHMSIYSGRSASAAEQAAVQYALNKGTIVVVAAGNGNDDSVYYPSAYPEALSVAGTEQDDSLASPSSFGNTVDIAAPMHGVAITREGGRTTTSGTSHAAAIVSGVIAVLKSAFPNATPAQLRNAVTSTAETCCGGKIAGGRINAIKAYNALAGPQGADTTPPTVKIVAPANQATVSGTLVHVSYVATDDRAIGSVKMTVGGHNYTSTKASDAFSWQAYTMSEGTYDVQVTAYDTAGNSKTASLKLTLNKANPDTTKPTVTLTTPTQNSTVSGTVPFKVDASDASGIAYFALRKGGQILDIDVEAPYEINVDTTKYPDGPTDFDVWVYDVNGNSSGPRRRVTIKNTVKQGDLNGDGKVNINDLSMLLTAWGKADAKADLNSSGKVDISDLSILLSKWG